MRLAGCLLLFGCGRIGFNAGPGDGANATGDVGGNQEGAAPDAPLCGSLAQLAYNFDGTGAALWMPYMDPGMTVSESGDMLVIPLPDQKTGTAGYFSTCTYDLTGQRVFVTAAVVPRVGSRTDMYLAIGSQADAIGINVTSGATQAYRIKGASYTQFASVAYDAVQHKVWQMREAGGTLFWEASPDGTTFTTLYSATPPISVTAVQLLLFADAISPASTLGSAEFSKLNIP